MSDQQETKIAVMGADIAHLKESFDEFKEETKGFHEHQTRMLDELNKKWVEFSGLFQSLTTLQRQVNDNAQRIKDLEEEVKAKYVSKEELYPIKKLVYGFVGIVLLSVIGAVVGLVIIK